VVQWCGRISPGMGTEVAPDSPSMSTFWQGETRRPFSWNSSAYAYARSARLQSRQARSTQKPMSLLGFIPCFFASSNTLQSKSKLTRGIINRMTASERTVILTKVIQMLSSYPPTDIADVALLRNRWSS